MSNHDILGIAKGFLPDLAFGGLNFFAWIIIIIVVVAVISVLTILYILNKSYNKKIVIYEKIAGRFTRSGFDRAKEIKFSTAGDTITYLRKRKKYIPNPSIQSGPREYWYFVREDDEWVNFGLKDLDEESRQAGARFLDKEMRYARTSIQKGLRDRYDQPTVWQKYGIFIISFSYVALIGVMAWLLMDKWVDISSSVQAAMDTSGVVLQKVDKILISLDNVCAAGVSR